MLRIAWTASDGPSGTATLEPGTRFVLARRMELPEQQLVVADEIAGSSYVFLRLPYVSDPALVVTATAGYPVVHRGQRANGAIVELATPTGRASSPEPGQSVSLTESGTRIRLRFPALTFTVVAEFEQVVSSRSTGTVQLGVDTFEHDDAWLVGAIAVALSPEHGVVGHGDLKTAFAAWRGQEVLSDGTFDRSVLRPALESRAIELPGPRLNKILYLVERCRQTSEFPPRVLDDVRARLAARGVEPH